MRELAHHHIEVALQQALQRRAQPELKAKRRRVHARQRTKRACPTVGYATTGSRATARDPPAYGTMASGSRRSNSFFTTW